MTGYERGTFEERPARTESSPRQSRKNSEDDSRANNNIRNTIGILSVGILSVAAKLFFETLTALGKRGFVASTTDPCMFVHKDMICLVYVDDCLVFSKDKSNINKMIASLAEDFDLKEETMSPDFSVLN